jgi:hypothetical protein
MSYTKPIISSFFILSLCFIGLQAQEAIPASGGSAIGDGGTVSYSVGQVFYTTISGASGSVAQGVQQPFEISVVTAIEEAIGINLSVSAYPNPAKDYLQLKVENYESESLFYQLYDLNGKLLIHKKVEDSNTSIPMNGFSFGTYFLKITDNKKEVKTFKIIKN